MLIQHFGRDSGSKTHKCQQGVTDTPTDYPTKHLEELLSPVGRDRGKNAKLVSATFLFQPYVYEFRITAHDELSQLSKSLQIVKKMISIILDPTFLVGM